MKLYPLLLVAVFAIGIASAQVSIVNDTLFNLDNNAYLKVLATQTSTNITIFKSTDSPASTLQFYINGTPIRFTADTNKTLSNISYNNVTDVVTYTGNGVTGYLNVSARMNLTQTVYNLNVDGTINQNIQSDVSGWVTFNYTGWSQNQHEFEISRVVTTYIPPTPASLANITGNFFVNHSWQAGSGNATDSFNVNVNGTWHNGSNTYYNNSGLSSHGWSNISVYAWNNSGTGSMNSTPVSQNTQVPNNAPVQAGIGSKTVDENQTLSFTVSATDADGDTITYGTNESKGTFNTGTGQFTWTPTFADSGIYVWYFNSSDGYGGVDSETITVTVTNLPLTIISRSPSADPASTEGGSQSFNLTLNRTANVTWYINGTSVQTNTSITLASYANRTAGAGHYNITATVSDTYDTLSTMWNWTVTPAPTYIPPTPANLANITGNFFVNHTWSAGGGNVTDSFNVNVNGTWHNGTNTYYNNSGLSPHGWSNISVYARNNSGTGSMNSTPVSQNTQVPNNAPVQAGIGSKSVSENQTLSFTVSAADADGDTITYGTNATRGTFNTGTGQFTWTPTFGESGSYVWYFNSSDSYGGVDSETITVTVTGVPLTITTRSPSVDPMSTEGTSQSFNLTLNRTANVTWYINGTSVQTNTSIEAGSYTNRTASAGHYSITASVSDGYDIVSTMWNWTVTPVPTYIPPTPASLANITGNFFVNHSWQAGSGNATDSFNVNVNGTWHNGTNTYYNNSGLSPHGWSNISVYSSNNSGLGRTNSIPASQNTQVPNNAPVQAGIGGKSVSENQTLSFTVSAADADGDTITYGTNATRGTLNPGTGQFTWTPTFGESGSYVWYFNSSDSYGGTASETITVTVTHIPLSITSRSPGVDPTTITGSAQTFTVILNRSATVTWYINGISVQTNSSITSASYTNLAAGVGIYNVTASVSAVSETTSTMWNWTVNAVPAGAPGITSFAPSSPVNNTEGSTRTFNITVNQTVDVTWYINGTIVFNQTNVTGSSYTNTSAAFGIWNVTATANNSNGAVSMMWIWNVSAALVINITSPANNSVNDTGSVNITVTLNMPGTALLNWEGINESMNGAGTNFYKNKVGLISGNYSFRVYANDSGVSNVSETRIIAVNRTTVTGLSNYTDPLTGNVNRTLNLLTPGGNSTLIIFNGTNATLNGTPVTEIIIDSVNRVNSTFVVNLGRNEKLIGENISLGPAGARFSPDIQIRLNYTDEQLTAAGITASTLRVKLYNTTTNTWVDQVPYTLNTTGKYITANVSHFSTFALIGTAAAPVPAPAVPTPGGGGGGAGAISPEPVNNIDTFEIMEEYLGANVPASYIYTTPDLVISEVLITPAKNFGTTSIRVEMLKDVSKIEGVTPPEGIVYKYANIWVGAKELESEQGIIDAFIGFKVDRSWLAENNLGEGSISLLRWDGSKWVSLETEPRSIDEQFVYYMAKTSGFSPFAIVAGSPYPIATIAAVETPVLIKPTLQKITESGVLLWGYIFITVVFIGLVIFILMRYKKPVKVYEKAMEIKPGDADAWYSRGFDLYEQGNYDEAIKAYDKAIEMIHKSGKEKKD